MITYCKQNTNLFKVNNETKTIEQVSNAEDSKSTSWVNKDTAYGIILKAIEENSIELITEEEFNTARQEVFTYLSSL
jgi:hypothetical protein